MAAQAGEAASVTYRARLTIFGYLARCVAIEPVVRMGGRLEAGYVYVTLFATERRVDSIVAHEAVGHVREVCVADFTGAFKSSVASGAGIGGVEIGTVHIGRLSQVCS